MLVHLAGQTWAGGWAAGYIVDFVHLHWLDKAGATHTWPRYSFSLVILYIIRAVVERMLCMVQVSSRLVSPTVPEMYSSYFVIRQYSGKPSTRCISEGGGGSSRSIKRTYSYELSGREKREREREQRPLESVRVD